MKKTEAYRNDDAVFRRRLGDAARTFRKYRLQASATEIADAIGAPLSMIYHLEHGEVVPLPVICFYLRKGWIIPPDVYREVCRREV